MVGEPAQEAPQEPAEVKEKPDILDTGISKDIEMLRMSNVLGLNDIEEAKQFEPKIKTITDWAELKGAKSIEDAVNMIRELGARMSGPRAGETFVRNLAEYAYLEMERIKIDKAMKGLEL